MTATSDLKHLGDLLRAGATLDHRRGRFTVTHRGITGQGSSIPAALKDLEAKAGKAGEP